ncbi:hypothetical protein RN22_18920 [Grimontia sp. AD028]|nr:hypothetical protein RN22_18920 [Grimontia sp. AD028]
MPCCFNCWRINGRFNKALLNHFAIEGKGVLIRFQAQVVADTHFRQNEADLFRKMTADTADTLGQWCPLLFIDQMHQSITQRQRKGMHVGNIIPPKVHPRC